MKDDVEIVTRKQFTLFRDLYIWLKFTLVIAGIYMFGMFFWVNFLGRPMVLNTIETPIMLVPNAYIQEPRAITEAEEAKLRRGK